MRAVVALPAKSVTRKMVKVFQYGLVLSLPILMGFHLTWTGDSTGHPRIALGMVSVLMMMMMMMMRALMTNVYFQNSNAYIKSVKSLNTLCDKYHLSPSYLSSLSGDTGSKGHRWETPESDSQPLCCRPLPCSKPFNDFPNIHGMKSKGISFLLGLCALSKLLFSSCAHCDFYHF